MLNLQSIFHATTTFARHKRFSGLAGVGFLALLFHFAAEGARAEVIISEFMASNSATLLDEDDDSSDWIELYNTSAETVSLTGWFLTDDASDLEQWEFPQTDIAPGAFLLLFASGKDRRDPAGQLHTNFALDPGGEYLALIAADGVTVHSEIAPKYPKQLRDLSYGLVYYSEPLVSQGGAVTYHVPSAVDSALADGAWAAVDFDDSAWQTGELGFRFGEVSPAGLSAYWNLDETPGSAWVIDTIGGNNGVLIGDPEWLPGEGQIGGAIRLDGAGDYISVGNESSFDFTNAMSIACWIQVAGFSKPNQTIISKGDAAWRLQRSGETNKLQFVADGATLGSPAVTGASDVADGLWHHVAAVYDGATMMLYLDGALDASAPRQGSIAQTDDPVWIGANSRAPGREFNGLLDDMRVYGRALTAQEAFQLYAQSAGRTDVQAAMQYVNASLWTRMTFQLETPEFYDVLDLRMQYEDGFVAYLNGQEVARRNANDLIAWNSAAASNRPLADAFTPESINLMPFHDLLTTGVNVLAIQAMNDAVHDPDFLLLPQLRAANSQGVFQYFTIPTPGWANVPGALGLVGDTEFSHDRGFYTESFDLLITCDTPEAEIRYTTDGSDPAANRGTLYTDPVPITQTTILRAAAFRAGYLSSNIDTQTYIFVEDVKRQSPAGQKPAPGWPNGSVNGQVVNYGMDPDIVNSAAYSDKITSALLALPSISLVSNISNFFSASKGIIVNANEDGRDWERPASLELINPDGSPGFQIDAGVRVRGGYSRSDSNPKHAYRIFFRPEYGKSRLKFPLFEDEGAKEFEKIDFRTAQNYSWSFNGNGQNTMVREVWSRDVQRDMGQYHTRSRYYHLYMNGHYWGIFMTQERSEARFAETYMGGDKDDYDVVKVERGPYSVQATDGDTVAWRKLWTMAKAGFANDANYYKALGKNPDGSPNPTYEKLVDVDNLIEYMLVIYFTGNFDAPISNFLGNNKPNNFYGVYNRNNPDGWQFFAHDAEHSLGVRSAADSRIGPYPAGDNYSHFNPQWLHQKLIAHPEYRARFGDLAHKHFANNGLLSPTANKARFSARTEQIEMAIIAESARWGDSKKSTPFKKTHWTSEVNKLLTQYFPSRTNTVLSQFKSKDWYPKNVAAPVFNQHGGNVQAGFSLIMGSPAPQPIQYTLDGADPRLPGGAINTASALPYNGPITLSESVVVRARRYENGQWSALNEARFLVNTAAAAGYLAITEIHYNPTDPTTAELLQDPDLVSDDFEFIELLNISANTLDLANMVFATGITFDFATLGAPTLAPGEYMVIPRDLAAFQIRYGSGIAVASEYSGKLSNGGEELELLDGAGTPIHLFEYNDGGSWPGRADGDGSSLELKDPHDTIPADYSSQSVWRSSSEWRGSPGRAGAGPLNSFVINEVLTHTDPPQYDYIELLNTTDAMIDIGGWTLSDSTNDYFKFSIPSNTLVASGGFALFDETDFNPTPLNPGPGHFGLSGAHGDEVYLMANEGGGNFRFVDDVSFGGAANGEAFGRWPDATGDLYPMSDLTPQGPNSGPRVGPLVISEVHYHPVDETPSPSILPDDLEFIEVYNPTAESVNLTDWRIRKGIDYDFVPGSIIAPHGVLVVVSFDPLDPLNAEKLAAFRSVYGVAPTVPLVGPYAGQLDNGGENVQLQRPDEPPLDEPEYTPHMVEDEANYNDAPPWPKDADGAGRSLHRLAPNLFGNDGANWNAALPTPGSVSFPEPEAPQITSAPPVISIVGIGCVYSITASGFPAPTFTVEGLPAWLAFDGAQKISGVPGATDIGATAPITITAKNAAGQDTQEFTIRVYPQGALDAAPAVWVVR